MFVLILISLVLAGILGFAANYKDKENKRFVIFKKVIGLLFIFFYFCKLVTVIDVFEDAYSFADFYYGQGTYIEVIILRLLTNAAVLGISISPFFKHKGLDNLICFFFPLVFIFNMVEFQINIEAMIGEVEIFSFTHTQLLVAIYYILGLAYCLMCLVNRIKNKDLKTNFKEILKTVGTLLFYVVIGINMGALGNIFGYNSHNPKSFNRYHRYFLYFAFAYLIILFISLRKKDKEYKWFVITSLSAGLFRLFFDFYGLPVSVTQLPLHLCHFGVIMVLVTCITRNKTVFYFTFFMNILGAAFAMLAPSETTGLTSSNVIHFWYEHISLVVIIANMMALNLFDRPKFKNFLPSVGLYTIYYLVVMTVNMKYWQSGVNYFFMNGNKNITDIVTTIFSEKLFGSFGRFFATLQAESSIVYFNVFGETWKLYPVYYTLLYFGYLLIILITWIGLRGLFEIADNHYQMAVIKKEKGIKMFDLNKLINKKKKVEPMYPEDKGCVRISHFSKVYAGQNYKSVDDFSLTIHGGEVYGFLGHNGAGKSTTIKSLVGIQTITEGTISVCGFDIEKQAVEAKLNIGYVSDNHAVYEQLTGREYINYVANLYLVPKKEREERFEKYVKMFNLQDAIDREIKGYSHGMKQKIVVIASLMHDPKVWVLDEPLTGLDPTSSFQIKECMRDHANRGNIVFFSSHVIEVVEKICDKICIIGHGKLIGEWDLHKLNETGESLENLYMKYVANQNLNISVNDKKADLTTKEGR